MSLRIDVVRTRPSSDDGGRWEKHVDECRGDCELRTIGRRGILDLKIWLSSREWSRCSVRVHDMTGMVLIVQVLSRYQCGPWNGTVPIFG